MFGAIPSAAKIMNKFLERLKLFPQNVSTESWSPRENTVKIMLLREDHLKKLL